MRRFRIALVLPTSILELENNVEGLHETLPAEFDSFVKWSASIQPLYEKKRPPEPGDWLDKYPEGGQTFAQNVAFCGKQPVQFDAPLP